MSINEFEGKAPLKDESLLTAEEGEAKARPAAAASGAKPNAKKGESWGETIQTILIALLIAGVVRTFLFQPFNIPSESMKPTLLVGDFLFVSKFSYGFSKYSFPITLPIFSGRVLGAEPTRGDVIVFKTPSDDKTDYIKRVIGLPGDTIQVKGGVLFINGQAVPRRALGPYTSNNPMTGMPTTGTLYEETLPNGVKYTTLDLGESRADDTDEFIVPPGHYFMMGDNRDNSEDSRFPVAVGGVGYVPAENLEGKAEILFFSMRSPHPFWAFWTWPLDVRYARLFHMID